MSVHLDGIVLFGAFGQAIGVEVVVDTAFYGPNTPTPDDDFDPEGLLDGYVSYLVYAKFQNPTDELSAVFADVNLFAGRWAFVIANGRQLLES